MHSYGGYFGPMADCEAFCAGQAGPGETWACERPDFIFPDCGFDNPYFTCEYWLGDPGIRILAYDAFGDTAIDPTNSANYDWFSFSLAGISSSTPTVTVQASAPQSTGKSIQVGSRTSLATGTADANGTTYTTTEYLITRMNADGTVDTTFGTGGVVDVSGHLVSVYVYPPGSPGADSFIVLDDNGTVTQYSADGTSIGWTLAVPHASNAITAVTIKTAIQQDGKILFVSSEGPGNSAISPILLRYKPNGGGGITLDTTFGTGGTVHNIGTTGIPVEMETAVLVLEADGKILYAGTGGTNKFAVMRFSVSGALDPTFGAGGISVATVPGTFIGTLIEPVHVALQPDGKIVLATTSNEGLGHDIGYVVARLTPEGLLDTSFGSGGAAILPLSPAGQSTYNGSMSGLVIDPTRGRIFTYGTVTHDSAGTGQAALSCLSM
jgi:uncharacterized delta-60 repeat protein